jgi:hypothetical protein
MLSSVKSTRSKIATGSMLVNLDAAQLRSYPGSGTTWTDLSGNDANGTLTNGPTFNSGNGGYISFDGSNDRIDITKNLNNFTGGITLEAWVYATTTTDFGRIIELGNGVRTNNIAMFRLNSSNFLGVFFQYPDGVNATLDIGVNNVYTLNTWHHFVFTANGTNWRLYKNGSQVAITTQSYLPTNTTRAVNTIASTSGSYREYFGGRIPIVRVYGRALSATEVGQNYDATKLRFI